MKTMALVLAALWIFAAGAVPAPAADNQAPPPSAADNQAPPPIATDNQVHDTPITDNQAPAPVATDNQAAVPTATDNQAPAAPAAPPAAPAPAAAPAPPPKAPPVYISMDFTDVDLPVLIKFISEQTKKNFIFDERVQGKITIISPRRITVDEAYNVFISVLQVKGFATVEQGNTIKIVPLREARQESLPTEKEAETAPASEFITRLIPLQNLEAPEVVTVLAPLVSKDGLLTSFPASNTLILIDSRSNVDRMMKLLTDLDRAGAGTVLRIYQLKYANVTEVAKTLDTLYQEQAVPGAPGQRPRAGRPGKARGIAPKFIADPRTNSIIAVAPLDLLSDVEDLIRKIDVPSPENTGKINVYYLENANAEEMAKVLATLAEKRATGPAGPAVPAATGPAAVAAKGVISAELEGGVRITADGSTNSLIIIASVNDYQTLLEVIKKLDIRRRQVFVEGLIMEISLDKSRDIGVEFRGAVQTNQGNAAVLGGSNFNFVGNVNDLFKSLAFGNPMVFPGTGLLAGGIGGNVRLNDNTTVPAIAGIIRAAQEHNNVNILSSPHLLTLDNKEAEIIVGENIPFITSQSRDTTNLANVINTVERKDVGITLRITPHIHESDFVNLEIFQESSAISATSLLDVNTVGPTTTKRSAKTSVLVRNGDTVVLGGMMQEQFSTLERKVPLLGDIPLLGYLFRFKSVTRNKTNLLIFLTPHVIKAPEDLLKATDTQRKKMDKFIEENKGELESIVLPKKETGGK